MASPSAKAQPGRRAGTDAESRANRFMRSALGILGETGRTDFTVLEVVERSKTSLRAFYQHFATKDELLLALVERIMADASERWRRWSSPDSAWVMVILPDWRRPEPSRRAGAGRRDGVSSA